MSITAEVISLFSRRLRSRLARAASAVVLAGCACARGDAHVVVTASSERGRAFFEHELTTLATSLASLDTALRSSAVPDPAPAAFRAARASYKNAEALLMYYVPIRAAVVNGPRAEGDDDAVGAPVRSAPIGFQVIEAALFDGSITRDSARKEIVQMRRVLDELRTITRDNPVDAPSLIDAARLQLARTTVLGLAGFDADPSGDAIIEAAASMDGIRALLDGTEDSSAAGLAADSLLRAAANYLRANPDFATFDRLRFIVAYANPIGEQLGALQKRAGDPPAGPRRLWRAVAGTPFVASAFDALAFAPAHGREGTPAIVALGARMFSDPRLSHAGERSCASCHRPDRVFTDGLARAAPLPGQHASLRNTPSLVNVAFEPSLFAEGRARSLETQIGVVLESRAEMASSVDEVARRLTRDASYRAAFDAALPDRERGPVTSLEVRQVLAAYLRSLTAFDSRFDRATRGDTLALSADEKAGFTLFMGKGKCATCHFVPLFNGVVPPDYRSGEAEVIGVPSTRDTAHATLDPDPGRANVEDVPNNRAAFKVPGLRNVALTAPYMHNGVFQTLDQVIEFYDRGGGAGLGIDVPSQTLSSSPLKLTVKERAQLVAFLGALTDTTSR
jgi:cytochrome c peroxidase